ncbi:MAG: hypothetical protein P8179_09715 [Candidatus Thiodiazotropha sp.]
MKSITYRIVPFLALGLLAANSQAALFDRGGGLIYDDVLDVTWLQDVTYVLDKKREAGVIPGYARAVNWYQAMDFISEFSYNVQGFSTTGWRLPEISGYSTESFNASGTATGSQVNELAHMYYNNLGFDAYAGNKWDPDNIPLPTEYSISPNFDNINLFTHLENAYLNQWSGNQDPVNDRVWGLHMHIGDTILDGSKGYDGGLIWAVHDGDISTVPVPPALWLMGSGMALMGFVSKKRRSPKASA